MWQSVKYLARYPIDCFFHPSKIYERIQLTFFLLSSLLSSSLSWLFFVLLSRLKACAMCILKLIFYTVGFQEIFIIQTKKRRSDKIYLLLGTHHVDFSRCQVSVRPFLLARLLYSAIAVGLVS